VNDSLVGMSECFSQLLFHGAPETVAAVQWGAYAVGALCALFAYIYLRCKLLRAGLCPVPDSPSDTHPAYNVDGHYTAPVVLFAFLIGASCRASIYLFAVICGSLKCTRAVLTLGSALEAGVSTIFVGLGEDPQIMAERSPALFSVRIQLRCHASSPLTLRPPR
jgi:hypothetical protein